MSVRTSGISLSKILIIRNLLLINVTPVDREYTDFNSLNLCLGLPIPNHKNIKQTHWVEVSMINDIFD